MRESQTSELSVRTIRAAWARGGWNGLLELFLRHAYASVAKKIQVVPGAEMRAALAAARLVPNCQVCPPPRARTHSHTRSRTRTTHPMRTRGKRAQVFLGDRPIGITLQRTFARLSLLDKVRLAYTLLREPWDIPEQEIEKLKVRPPVSGCRHASLYA